jgi:hypothetical protein
MCYLMLRRPWAARGRFREPLKGSAGSWLSSWSTGHSNGLPYFQNKLLGRMGTL